MSDSDKSGGPYVKTHAAGDGQLGWANERALASEKQRKAELTAAIEADRAATHRNMVAVEEARNPLKRVRGK